MPITGKCLCGSIAYLMNGKPQTSMICHCKNCQRQAGTAFSTIMGVAKEDFELTSHKPKLYVDQASSTGNPVSRYFCENCGSPVYTTLDAFPDMVFVKAGTLDDTSTYAPTMHIWCDSQQQWLSIDDDVMKIPTQLDGASSS